MNVILLADRIFSLLEPFTPWTVSEKVKLLFLRDIIHSHENDC